jgi:hypothetical protein
MMVSWRLEGVCAARFKVCLHMSADKLCNQQPASRPPCGKDALRTCPCCCKGHMHPCYHVSATQQQQEMKHASIAAAWAPGTGVPAHAASTHSSCQWYRRDSWNVRYQIYHTTMCQHDVQIRQQPAACGRGTCRC